MVTSVIKVWIEDDGAWLTLPPLTYDITGVNESTLAVMESGRMVEDIRGERLTISGTFNYIPQATFSALVNQVRRGGFNRVEYVDLDGSVQTGDFKIDPLKASVFSYDSAGNPIWCNQPISMTAKEVTLNV